MLIVMYQFLRQPQNRTKPPNPPGTHIIQYLHSFVYEIEATATG